MLKSLIKSTAAGALYYSGVLDRFPRPSLTVFGYHRVLEEPLERVATSPLGMIATREMFERQLAYAARRYRIASLEELEEACERDRPLPPKACLITFDDGWHDNYAVAFPVLRRMGIPATIFVSTDFIGADRPFWFTTLMLSLLNGSNSKLHPGDGKKWGFPDDVTRELDRLGSLPRPLNPWRLDPLIETLKRHPEASIHQMVEALARYLDGPQPQQNTEPYFLTWDQIREMEQGGISFGSHTCSHRILTQLEDREAEEELRRSRDKLETELAHPVTSFAFPNGDYKPNHMRMAWEAGYRLFFVSTRVHPGGPERRVFSRPCVHDRVGRGAFGGFSPSLLEVHLAGVVDRIRGRR